VGAPPEATDAAGAVVGGVPGDAVARAAALRAGAVGRPGIFRGALRPITAGLLIITTLIAFEAMAVAAALPTLARELHGVAWYGWAFTGFLVANVVAMVISGAVCDRRGPRLPLAAGLVLFLAGLVVAGLAPVMAQVIVGRVVQGLGAGLLVTVSYVLIGEVYPSALRPKVFAAMSSAWVLPSLVGPPVSGLLSQHLTWRLVFLGLAPFVAIGGVLLMPALRILPVRSDASPHGAGLGRVGRALVLAVAIALLQQAGQHPTPVWLVAGAAGLAALLWALRGLLPAGTARLRPGVPTAVAFRGILAGAFFGVDALLPLTLSVQHGYSASIAALPLLVGAVGWSIGSWIQGRYVGPHRYRLIRAGFACITVAAAGTALAAWPTSPGWLAIPAWSIAGLGAGLGMASVGILLLDRTTAQERGRDSAALQLADGVMSALTTGLGGVLVAAAVRHVIGYTAAFVAVDLTMAVLAATGAVLARRAAR
jgi:MFS family permease